MRYRSRPGTAKLRRCRRACSGGRRGLLPSAALLPRGCRPGADGTARPRRRRSGTISSGSARRRPRARKVEGPARRAPRGAPSAQSTGQALVGECLRRMGARSRASGRGPGSAVVLASTSLVKLHLDSIVRASSVERPRRRVSDPNGPTGLETKSTRTVATSKNRVLALEEDGSHYHRRQQQACTSGACCAREPGSCLSGDTDFAP